MCVGIFLWIYIFYVWGSMGVCNGWMVYWSVCWGYNGISYCSYGDLNRWIIVCDNVC